MAAKDLIEKILSVPSETRTIEFKRLGSRNESINKTLETIVAMSNTDGGLIILGIDDPLKTYLKGHDRIFGIEENISLYDELGHTVKKISPPLSDIWPPNIITYKEKNVRIALLSVPKATDCFRSLDNQVWIRLERGNKRLSPQEIIHFSYIKGFHHADKELVQVDITLLKTEYYESWRRKRGINDQEIQKVLEKTGLARKNSQKKLLPTRAAVLLFAEFPNDLLDTKCTIRVFQYEGKLEIIHETLNLLGTPKTIYGPAIKLINESHEYVLNLLRTGIRVPSGFVTSYQIPERAVKEVITNAVIHRDYHTKRDITIKIFEDRVEVESPGLLPFNITPSNIGIERAYGYRNDLLVKHLREFPDPPNLDQNEGVKAIRTVMRRENLYPPIFITYPFIQDGIKIVLLNSKAPGEWDKISNHLITNKYLSNSEARKVLKIEDTIKISKLLNRWVKQGLLTKITPRTGAKRNVRYRLPTLEEKNLFTNDESK